MQINIIRDQSQNSLPDGLVAVGNYFDTTFTSPIDIDLSCGMTGDTNIRVPVGSSRRRFHEHRPLRQQLTQIDVAYDQSLRTLLVEQGVGML
jgi:hypothetical protein